MIDQLLQNRRYVREYDSTADIPQSLVDALLQRTWKVTPSKNNFMPYTVHVVKDQKYKDLIYLNCASNEGRVDGIDNPLNKRYQQSLPNYANILSCSYVLIFTMRLEDKPSPFQQRLIDNGHRYEAVDESLLNSLYSTASFECGLFADTFSALCLDHEIDVSFTGCFQRNLDTWKDIPFVTRKPIMIMTIGKGITYLDNQRISQGWADKDLRPDYERIVNFVK